MSLGCGMNYLPSEEAYGEPRRSIAVKVAKDEQPMPELSDLTIYIEHLGHRILGKRLLASYDSLPYSTRPH